MEVHKCPHCGESYSTTYRDCPFCEEEEAYAGGREIRRRGGRRGGRREPTALGALLTLAIVVLCCALAYYFFGEKIMESIGLRQQVPPGSSVEEIVPPSLEEEILPPGVVEPENPGVAMPSTGDGTGNTGNAGTVATAAGLTVAQLEKLPKTLKLSSNDFTAKVGEAVKLTVSGGSGTYFWLSVNPEIATVSDQGIVTGVSSGTKALANATIYVTDGKAVSICTARVRGTPSANVEPDSPNTSGGGEIKLSSTDFTMSVKDAPVQLKLSGTTVAVSWSCDKTGVATVNERGMVSAVAKGTATVTATVDGKSFNCTVRVK